MKERSKGRKLAGILWKALLLYILLCIIVPPLLGGELSAGGGTLSGASGAGERVLCIDDNDEALLWRLRLIASAKERIILSTFDFRADESGRDVLSALLDASERGVEIQVLVDGVNGALYMKHNAYFRALAAAENVELRLYAPLHLLNFWRFNYRLHDKYLIIDEDAYLLGGRNIHNAFLGRYSASPSIDRDILVLETQRREDTSLQAVEEYFAGIWDLPVNRALRSGDPQRTESRREELRQRYAALCAFYDVDTAAEDWLEGTLETERIELLTNPTGSWNKESVLWNALCEKMNAGKRISIQTPYIVCSRGMYRDLRALTDSGVELRFLTNAAGNGANLFGCSDYLNEKRRILNTGAEIFEYAGGESLHTKTILIDGDVCLVGGFNVDMRSARLDTEMMLCIESPELTRQLAESMDAALEQSLCVYPDGTTLPGAAYEPSRLGFGKAALYTVVRLICIPFRYLF